MIQWTRLACLVIFFLAGCSVKHLPDVATQQPETYRYRNSVDGIDVAVDPYTDEQRIIEYFGNNILSEGILPVHLVIRNNSGSTYMFDPRDVFCSFAIGKSGVSDNTATKDRTYQEKRVTESEDPKSDFDIPGTMAMANLAAQTGVAPPEFGAPYLILGGALVGWAVDHETQKKEVSVKSLARKQIFEKSLFRGETHSGFVYFKDKDQERLRNIDRLIVRMVEKPGGRAVVVIVVTKEGADSEK